MLVAVPRELTIPNARKNRTKINGSVILNIEMKVFLARTNPALLLAIKIQSSSDDRVRNRVKTMKATVNKGLSFMKPNAGDQRSTPTINIIAVNMDIIPVKVKPEFMNSIGCSALLRNRKKAISTPSILIVTRRLIQVRIVEASPMSASS